MLRVELVCEKTHISKTPKCRTCHDRADTLYSRVGDLENLVALTPARTPDGVRAQLQLALYHLTQGEISDTAVIALLQAERALRGMRR